MLHHLYSPYLKFSSVSILLSEKCFIMHSNRRISEKIVSWDFKKPFDLLANLPADELRSEAASSKNLQNFTWSGCWELNPVYTHPKRAYYRHTPPRLVPQTGFEPVTCALGVRCSIP